MQILFQKMEEEEEISVFNQGPGEVQEVEKRSHFEKPGFCSMASSLDLSHKAGCGQTLWAPHSAREGAAVTKTPSDTEQSAGILGTVQGCCCQV
jgi:hypothetical protein